MKLLTEFLPIFLFFIVYKFAGIYWATGAAIVASMGQFTVNWVKHKKADAMQIITLICIVLLGGATLTLHNELFIKWKPTAINWAFALAFLLSHFVGQKPLVQRIMEGNIQLSKMIWQRLNLSWVLFFGLTGAINIYVAYHFPTDVWVNFKLFGLMGLTLVFVLAQSLYLVRHVKTT